METNITPTPPLLQWSAHTAPQHQRSHQWYVRGAVVVLIGAAYGILSGNWSFALVVLLLAAVYFLQRNNVAPTVTIEIMETGFRLHNTFTPWTVCKDFWFIVTPLYTELHIARHTGLINRMTVVQTGTVDPLLIRQVLSRFLPERQNQKEKILDVIIRLCKL